MSGFVADDIDEPHHGPPPTKSEPSIIAPPPLGMPSDVVAGSAMMDESAAWFDQKFSLSICGKRFGSSAAKRIIFALAFVAVAAVAISVVLINKQTSPNRTDYKQ